MSPEKLTKPEESPVVADIVVKQARRQIWLARLSLAAFLACLVGFIILFPKMQNQQLEGIEPVKVTVTDVSRTTVDVKGNGHDFYDIKVSYQGKEYALHDGDSYWAKIGYTGTAYLYDGKIYAKESGPATETWIAKVYYVCLIGGFVLLIVTTSIYPKALRLKKTLKGQL